MKPVAKPSKVTVEAPADHPEVLDVRDAMQQVMDFFDLLTDQEDGDVVWRLISASAKSPLTVECAPYNMKTNASAFSQVMGHVSRIQKGMASLQAGDPLDMSFPSEKIPTAVKMFKRSLNGIGRTRFDFGNETSVEIFPELAKRSLKILVFNDDYEESNYHLSSRKREALGSIDGRIVNLNTDRARPSIRVLEHSSGREINCVISEDLLPEIESSLTAGDAWKRRRVRVRGTISYDSDGRIVRLYDGRIPIEDGRIQFIEPKEVTIEDLHDPDFTGGLPAHEYLDKLRENNFD